MFWSLYQPFGFILTALALVHFIRRRPDTYWLWIIIFGGWIGALVYIVAEVIPDIGLLRGSLNIFGRRQRIQRVEELVQQNPAAGNFEELGDLYLQDGKYARARECYDRALSSRTDHVDPFYRRAICKIETGDFAAAAADLERVVHADPKYDLLRAQGLLAHAYANLGQAENASALFAHATRLSTLSETMFNYASFLRQQGRHAEAREWARKILEKKPAMPGYLRRRERPWFRKAAALLKQIPSQ